MLILINLLNQYDKEKPLVCTSRQIFKNPNMEEIMRVIQGNVKALLAHPSLWQGKQRSRLHLGQSGLHLLVSTGLPTITVNLLLILTA